MNKVLLVLCCILLIGISIGCTQEDAENVWSQNIYPSTNNTYDIGSPSLQYQNGYFVNLWASNNITATNNISASYFIGDGSQLTGLEQGELILYFLNESSSDISGLKRLSSDFNASSISLEGIGLASGNTLMGTWITDIGVPSKNLLTGNIRVHVTGRQSAGTKNTQFFYQIWKCNSSGVELELISTSEYTNILTSTNTTYRIWSLSNEVSLNTSDRIKVKGYAYVSGLGSAPTVEAQIQGNTFTRLVIPVGAVSVEKFIPYIGAIHNLVMGALNISANSISASNLITIGNVSASALLTLASGNVSAGLAPLKFTAGSLLTVPVAGAMEFDGTGIYLTNTNHRRFISLASDSIITTVNSITVEPTILWNGTINANELKVNKVYEIKGCGIYSTHDANDQCTINMTVDSAVIMTITTPAGLVTNKSWSFDVYFTVRQTGINGILSTHGEIESGSGEQFVTVEEVAVDTTAINYATLRAYWSDTDNEVRLTQAWLAVSD